MDNMKQIDEMVAVFHLTKKVRLRYIWLPEHFPKLSKLLWERKHKKDRTDDNSPRLKISRLQVNIFLRTGQGRN